MATEADILSVQNNIPDDASEDGWDEDYIGGLLDAGLTVTKATLSFWSGRVGKYAALVDISESGSSRSLSQLFTQAKEAYQLWLEASKLEDNPTPTARYRASFHTLKRV